MVPKLMRPRRCRKTLGASYPFARRHISEERYLSVLRACAIASKVAQLLIKRVSSRCPIFYIFIAVVKDSVNVFPPLTDIAYINKTQNQALETATFEVLVLRH